MQKLKNFKPILVISGEPYSVFNEIFFKSLKKKSVRNIKSPILLIGSKNLLLQHMKKLGYKFKIKSINNKNIENEILDRKYINIINVNFKFNKIFDKISSNSTNYIRYSFSIALKIVKKIKIAGIINGPISKKHFNIKNFIGVTEYLARLNNKESEEVMLIFNKSLSVSPLTTHIPLKNVSKSITKNKIIKNVKTIYSFYRFRLKRKKIRFAITGLNPHCESRHRINEEKKHIIPAIKFLKFKKYDIKGPIPTDTLFIKKVRSNFDVIIGMYHDQVLTPIKTLYEFHAINLTLGLDFIRISPDHGPNNNDLGKNISNPQSLIESFKLIDKINAS